MGNNVGSEDLGGAIQELQNTLEVFNNEKTKADICFKSKDIDGYMNALRRRAEAIVGLSEKMEEYIDVGTNNLGDLILRQTAYFSSSAKEALELGGNAFAMGVLLTSQGDLKGDKNQLEVLIDNILEKLVLEASEEV